MRKKDQLEQITAARLTTMQTGELWGLWVLSHLSDHHAAVRSMRFWTVWSIGYTGYVGLIQHDVGTFFWLWTALSIFMSWGWQSEREHLVRCQAHLVQLIDDVTRHVAEQGQSE